MLTYPIDPPAGKEFLGEGSATALLEVPAAPRSDPMALVFLDSDGAAWIALRRAARIAGVCPRTVARYSASGLLVAKRIDCHRTLISVESVERLTGLTISREDAIPLREPTPKMAREKLIPSQQGKRTDLCPTLDRSSDHPHRQAAKAAGLGHSTYAKAKVIATKEKEQSPNA